MGAAAKGRTGPPQYQPPGASQGGEPETERPQNGQSGWGLAPRGIEHCGGNERPGNGGEMAGNRHPTTGCESAVDERKASRRSSS